MITANRNDRTSVQVLGNPLGGILPIPEITVRRWRLLTRNRPNNGYIWIEELKLMSEEGGTQLALEGVTGTASANSVSGGSYLPGNAFNDNYSDNGWSSAQFGSGQENWLEFNFDVAKTIRAFEIHNKPPTPYGALDFDIQYHDGDGWVALATYLITTEDYDGLNVFRAVMVEPTE